jgi:hypothetical protein
MWLLRSHLSQSNKHLTRVCFPFLGTLIGYASLSPDKQGSGEEKRISEGFEKEMKTS